MHLDRVLVNSMYGAASTAVKTTTSGISERASILSVVDTVVVVVVLVMARHVIFP